MSLKQVPCFVLVVSALAAPAGCFLPDWGSWPGPSASHGESSTLEPGESGAASTSLTTWTGGAATTFDATTFDATTNDATTNDATDGLVSSTSSSTTQAALPECGDGVVEGVEECDDGNSDPWDGCTNGCISTHRSCSPAVPGDPNCGEIGLYCVAEDTCGGCHQLVGKTCGDIDGGRPVCEAATGLCRECTPMSMSACNEFEICNPYTNECYFCIDNSQCPDSACKSWGGCVDPANVVWVQKQPLDCESKDGSPDSPYCEVQTALLKSPTAEAIMVKPGSGPLELPIIVDTNRSVALVGVVGEGEAYPEISGAKNMGPTIAVSNNADVSIERFRITGSKPGVLAVSCEGADVTINQSIITNNGGGITFNGCNNAKIKRTVFTANQGSISAVGDQIEIHSTFITDNEADLSPIYIDNTVLRMSYSTVVGNQGAYSSAFGCSGAGEVYLSNSVVLTDKPNKCDLSGDNVLGGGADAKALFQPPKDGVYRPTLALMNTATWWEDFDYNNYVDFEGDLRPNVNGALDYAGADRPAP